MQFHFVAKKNIQIHIKFPAGKNVLNLIPTYKLFCVKFATNILRYTNFLLLFYGN